MSKKTLLIHGFSYHLTNTFFGIPHSNKVGFKVFIEDEKIPTHLFNWGLKWTFNSLKSLNPFAYKKLYFAEKTKSETEEVQKKLRETLEKFEPEIIVTHSMGSHLIWEYFNKFGLPDFVKRVILVQADIAFNSKITNSSMIKKINSGELQIENYFCFYDPTLVLSDFLNYKARAGQIGLRNKYVKNHFFPLYKTRNLHISSIADGKFVERLMKDYSK